MRLLLLSLAFASLGAAASAAPSVEGDWLTDDRRAVVRIAPCGRQACGTIARLIAAGPNPAPRDMRNPDPRLRGRPILGMTILTGFTASGASRTGGRVYDPRSGRSYRSTLSLNADGSLDVTGCVLMICRSHRWPAFARETGANPPFLAARACATGESDRGIPAAWTLTLRNGRLFTGTG